MTEKRLSDRILNALQLAVAQKDIATSDLLVRALEMSATRNAGGKDFTERREFSAEVEECLKNLAALKAANKA